VSAISLQGAGKCYVKYDDAPMLVTSILRLRARSRRSRLWAVRGVDLEVDEGTCLGVIGRNGSGKSTLLQMLCGVTAPTEGRVRVRGRIAPLISVGVGFHPELTGRENIYVNGAILGLDRAAIDTRLESIVALADIGPFLDTPVKFYSSGMFVRLGFSVAVQAEPDVLLVDEVLAVGDLSFQARCYDRIEAIRARGATVVVVSHNLQAIRRMCDRVIVLEGGRVVCDADPPRAISALHQLVESGPLELGDEGAKLPTEPGIVEVEQATLVDRMGAPTAHLPTGEPAAIRLQVRSRDRIEHPVIFFTVATADGVIVYADSSRLRPRPALPAGELTTIEVGFTPTLATGSYVVNAGVLRGSEAFEAGSLLARCDPQSFYVGGRDRVHGIADLHAEFGAS
jgi:ABC-type polysaccharide/polyol phosphate transport system ATPase subunit